MKLSELSINQYAIVFSIKTPNFEVKRRLLEMGLTPGTIIKISKVAPLNDPIAINLRGYELCISNKEASYIFVEKL